MFVLMFALSVFAADPVCHSVNVEEVRAADVRVEALERVEARAPVQTEVVALPGDRVIRARSARLTTRTPARRVD